MSASIGEPSISIAEQPVAPSSKQQRGLPGEAGRLGLMAVLALVTVYTAFSGGGAPLVSADSIPMTASAADDTMAGGEPTSTTSSASSALTSSSSGTPSSDTSSTSSPAGTAGDAAIFSDDFETDAGGWEPVTGTWEVDGGYYTQTDAGGFDLISLADVSPEGPLSVEVKMRALGDRLGGGIILGHSEGSDRSGAYIVDFTDGGTFLRWGQYSAAGGAYGYVGGLDVGTAPAEWHTLRVEVNADATLIYVDDEFVGSFGPVPDGRFGLVTSESAVEFDEFVGSAL